MNVRNARVEQAVEPFYQPENLELQLIRTHDSSLDRGIHRRCVAPCGQDTDTLHNWTAKVFTSLESFGWVYLFRRMHLFSKLLDAAARITRFCLIAISKRLCYTLVASRSNRLRFVDSRGDSTMEDRTVLIKMAISTLAGLLFFDFAMFTTMLDLPIFWRNVWLGFCISFFVVALGAVFILCGDLNSEHSKPEDAKPKEG